MASGFSKGVLMKGIPFAVKEDDIKVFFKPIGIPDQNIRIIKYPDGKGTGLAFVKLQTQEEISRAMLMDNNHIGTRYVEVVPSDESEMYHLILEARSHVPPADLYRMSSSNKSSGARDRSPVRKKIKTRFCYFKGVPPGNNYKEVRRFFNNCLIGRNCIHLMKDAKGSFRGDGYVEFGNEEECMKGLLFNGMMLDGSVILVEPCTELEVEDIRGAEEERRERRRDGKERTPSPARRRRERYAATYGRDTLLREQEREYYSQYAGHDEGHYDRGYTSRVGSYGSHYSRPVVEASYYNQPSSHAHHTQDPYAYTRQVQHAGDGYSTATYAHMQLMAQARHSEREGFNSQTRSASYDYSHAHPTLLPPLAQEEPIARQPEQRVVRMEGLPYNVSAHMIMDFFHGYHIDYECVRIQCRDDGSQSGKAFVTFPSEKYAHAAVLNLNKSHIGGRYIELFHV